MKTTVLDMKNTPSKPVAVRKLCTPQSRPFPGHDGFVEFPAKTSPSAGIAGMHPVGPQIIRPTPFAYCPETQPAEDFGRKLFSPTAAGKAPGKGCNCKKSNCLKLYCDCFASGEYCTNCNCTGCYNNEFNERSRKEAIRSILDRNPNAFRPKIAPGPPTPASPLGGGEDVLAGRHNKGCACKKSGCLKKYCECFNAGIVCSENCRCAECRNFEESMERRAILAAPFTDQFGYEKEIGKEKKMEMFEITPKVEGKERKKKEYGAFRNIMLGLSGKRSAMKGNGLFCGLCMPSDNNPPYRSQ